ncbi:uncharacterized protein LOC21391095 [Morus notabilis]|uniref:uncharacterized protein LOC21391095 n=1 Tax=Morus notabilis TaxID=981085 RepID=UPI000CED2D13|nr:uncharacterized protein LOC21391095 [Morus notabilis]XP_024028821.1 uncharacterized protein LOC21391095 [Morus notabilis]
MKSKELANGKNHVRKKSVEEVAANQLERKVKPADIIWVKNHGGSWWLAQVVDENLISESSKPSKRSPGKVLVRLYGTYTYSYADPIKCRSEFDKILEQNNNSCREIFLRALEQDVARLKAGGSKRQRSKSKETNNEVSNKASKRGEAKDEVKGKSRKQSKSQGDNEGEGKSRKRKIKEDGMQKKPKPDEQSTGEVAIDTTPKHDKTPKKSKLNGSSSGKISVLRYQELSARRLKVMQSLGLAAPTGSPFCKSGQICMTL